jgi:hypothetical protein
LLAEHMLVARLGSGEIVDAVPLSFPTVAQTTEGDLDEQIHVKLEVDQAQATSFLPVSEDVESIELIASDMSVLLSVSRAALLAAGSGVAPDDAIDKQVDERPALEVTFPHPKYHRSR